MKVAIIGGKLQGVEAVYLAQQAGWDVMLIDKDENAPAAGLVEQFYPFDLCRHEEKLVKILKQADLIIPACENKAALQAAQKYAERAEVPLAFDAHAYEVSSSKLRSDQLFADHHIPAPRHWPACCLPVIAKPAGLSGSEGVRKIEDEAALAAFLAWSAQTEQQWIIQEYLEGPSFSLEVIGTGREYLTFQTTDLDMDACYDCKRVLAPTVLAKELEQNLHDLTVKIAGLLNLKGIMDVEVIEHHGQLKVLEIDARLPSQTPTVVLKSSGSNLLAYLGHVFVKGRLPALLPGRTGQAVIYEHLYVAPGKMETLGEHIMAGAGPLTYLRDFYGADEALTNYAPGRDTWVATLIMTADTLSQVAAKRREVLAGIKKHFHLASYIDSSLGNQ